MKKYRIITNSEREKFACERLWYFSSIEGLSAYDTPAPFRHGTIIHTGIDFIVEQQWRGVLATREMIVENIVEPWISRRRESSPRDIADDEEFAALAADMLAGYAKFWHHDDTAAWNWKSYEIPIARAIVHPVTGLPLIDKVDGAPRQWLYAGKIDKLGMSRVGKDLGGPRWWLSEIKTTSANSLQDYCAKLDWDRQTRGYAWMLRQPFAYDETANTEPINVAGVVYDVLRKAAPSPPEMTKNGKLSVAARLTTRELYERAIHENKLDPDDYRDHLEKLGGLEQFFHRARYPFSDDEVEAFGEEIGWVALRMIEAERSPFHPPQMRLCRSGGHATGCPGGFDQLCVEDGPMARSSFAVTSIRHAELPTPLCEPIVRIGAGKARATGFIKVKSAEEKRKEEISFDEPTTQIDDNDEDPFGLFGEPADHAD